MQLKKRGKLNRMCSNVTHNNLNWNKFIWCFVLLPWYTDSPTSTLHILAKTRWRSVLLDCVLLISSDGQWDIRYVRWDDRYMICCHFYSFFLRYPIQPRFMCSLHPFYSTGVIAILLAIHSFSIRWSIDVKTLNVWQFQETVFISIFRLNWMLCWESNLALQ